MFAEAIDALEVALTSIPLIVIELSAAAVELVL
jgi:hypothetical protein